MGMLSDIVQQSPVMSSGDGGVGGGNLNEYGVDPEVDPENGPEGPEVDRRSPKETTIGAKKEH